jgi:hypothetical protein
MAESSKEGYGLKRAVLTMIMIMRTVQSCFLHCTSEALKIILFIVIIIILLLWQVNVPDS